MRKVTIGLFLLYPTLHAQFLLSPRRIPEMAEALKPVPNEATQKCDISVVRPSLDYGFRYQAGYSMRTSMTDYVGSGHRLFLLTRITPEAGEKKPVYLGQSFRLPVVPENKSDMEVGGGFIIGPGRYQVDWMLIDDKNRVCRKHWTISAAANSKVKLAMPPNSVTDMTLRGIPRDNPQDDDARKIKLTIMLHATPVSSRRNLMRSSDEVMLLSTLSSILQRVRASSVRLVVFNLEKRSQLYSKDGFQISDLEQVDEAINKVDLGMVDYKVLQEPKGHLDFLNDLASTEVSAEQPSDVVIFLGPPARSFDKPAPLELAKGTAAQPHFFYVRLEPFGLRGPIRPNFGPPRPGPGPGMNPNTGLPDSISFLVKNLKGKSLTVHSPTDFSKAIELVKAK